MWLNYHHFEPRSLSNGPGIRSVFWLQGCTLHCPGCFNPETHSMKTGHHISIATLVNLISQQSPEIEGITISGGEPLLQYNALKEFLMSIKLKTNLTIILFSGFEWDEIIKSKYGNILKYIDVAITGRYRQSQRLAKSLMGSVNKEFHFLSDRYQITDFYPNISCDVIVDINGSIRITGIDPIHLS